MLKEENKKSQDKTSAATAVDDSNEKNQADDLEVRVYELGFLLKPSLSDTEAVATAEEFKNLVTEKGGEFISQGAPVMRPLAYTIEIPRTIPKEKYDHAYFGWIKFELSSTELKEFENKVSRHSAMIRHLIVKTVREDTFVSVEEAEEGEQEPADDSVAQVSSVVSEVEGPAVSETSEQTVSESEPAEPAEQSGSADADTAADQVVEDTPKEPEGDAPSSASEEATDDAKSDSEEKDEIDKSIEDLIVG